MPPVRGNLSCRSHHGAATPSFTPATAPSSVAPTATIISNTTATSASTSITATGAGGSVNINVNATAGAYIGAAIDCSSLLVPDPVTGVLKAPTWLSQGAKDRNYRLYSDKTLRRSQKDTRCRARYAGLEKETYMAVNRRKDPWRHDKVARALDQHPLCQVRHFQDVQALVGGDAARKWIWPDGRKATLAQRRKFLTAKQKELTESDLDYETGDDEAEEDEEEEEEEGEEDEE